MTESYVTLVHLSQLSITAHWDACHYFLYYLCCEQVKNFNYQFLQITAKNQVLLASFEGSERW